MCNRLNEVLTSARAVVASLDLDALSGSQVARVFEAGAELEKLGASLKVLAAPKVAQSETWVRAGHRTPEEWMARTSGTSVGQAKATVETGKTGVAAGHRFGAEVGCAVAGPGRRGRRSRSG